MRIAVLLTCFNRKEKTRECLHSLFKNLPACAVYLVDDASTDGTPDMVKKEYPQVHLIHGNGNLFWSRGMYTAWKEAIKGDYDYYLWLNDDMFLYENFFEELIACEEIGEGKCVVSGLVENLEGTKIIYGGFDERIELVQVSSTPQEIKYMHGNVVLIPKSIVNVVGIIDPYYYHDLGDVDYGLMVREHGYKVLATRKVVGRSDAAALCRVRLWNSNIAQRFKRLYSPLGSNPRIAFYFRRKHYGIVKALVYWIYLHCINILPDTFISFFFGDKYQPKIAN